MLPYLLTAALFLGLDGVIAADSSLVNFGLFESFTGLRWVRSSKPRLGGNWFSLVAIHLGCALLWAGIHVRVSWSAVLRAYGPAGRVMITG